MSRRQALAGFGGVSFDDAPRWTRTSELTEGPFYFEVDRVRSDTTWG